MRAIKRDGAAAQAEQVEGACVLAKVSAACTAGPICSISMNSLKLEDPCPGESSRPL